MGRFAPRIIRKTYYNTYYNGNVGVSGASALSIQMNLPPNAKFAKIKKAWAVAFPVETATANNVPQSAIHCYYWLMYHNRVNDALGGTPVGIDLILPFNHDGEINIYLLLNNGLATIECRTANCHNVPINVTTGVYFDIEYILD